MNTHESRRRARLPLLVCLLVCLAPIPSGLAAAELLVPAAPNTVHVDVVALDQPWTFNRLGSTQPTGMMFALARDVVSNDGSGQLTAGHVTLRQHKRPRPITLRVNAGQFLEIRFTNLLAATSPDGQGIGTRAAGVHIAGLELVPTSNPPSTVVLPGIDSDATWVGANANAYAQPGETRTYKYYAKAEGTFMLYSAAGDWNGQLQAGLFGAAIVEPANSEWYRSQVTHDDLRLAARLAPVDAGQPGSKLAAKADAEGRQLKAPGAAGEQLLFSFVEVEAARETVHKTDVVIVDGRLFTPDGRPLIDYNAVYPAYDPRTGKPWGLAGQPILRMTQPRADGSVELIYTDLTAIVTGPGGGEFPFTQNGPGFYANPTYPGRRQPFREIAVMYHEIFAAVQAFPQFTPGTPLSGVLNAGTDAFAINYGSSGIGAEVLASRLGVGPMGGKQSVDLKFEEFFLSSWACGDPAMLVDNPANTNAIATKAFYPDDPSNVYHSYMRDHVTMRLLHTGSGITHVHHLHAHQWLRTPNSDDAHYLDSQLIAPGSTYTLEMVYNGSGNRNETVGDSIFHCHFYPHFAGGMWALWRVHDVFEAGTKLDADGRPVAGLNRALPDAEIVAGTPIPAIVPLPTLAMAPAPAPVKLIDQGTRAEVVAKSTAPDGTPVYDNPGFPFFVPGVTGHRAPHPPLDYAWEESSLGVPKLDANGQKIYLDGGLPRHQVLDGTIVRELHTRWDFSKDFIAYDHPEMPHKPIAGGLIAFELPQEGTAVEKAAMAAHATRTRASFLPNGDPGNFTLNGLPPVPGAPFANPSVDADGNGQINTRRYQGAAIQTDVVLTKQGWHYPQQRFLSLWQDVKDYLAGTRPPQPLFFRSHTGETIEFWHTNLVPDYYDLDDFQIRTPTDIIGQHIHLVKFDVTSSDGAGNGWNYEDGTFSPDEVRGRIDAMNLSGGIYAFDPKTQFKGTTQRPLTATPAPAVFGPAPAGQSWIGAQTTIQRWDTDPVENNQGEDRTLRTVFTHDHFGPSTHQQVGLYGGLLVEPQGSTWYDPISGGLLYDTSKRTDGGPTSWQANIVTANRADSYREFALEFADFQLAYLAGSPSKTSPPTAPLFTTSAVGVLEPGTVSTVISGVFTSNGITLAADAQLTGSDATGWTLTSLTKGIPEDPKNPAGPHHHVHNDYQLTLLAAATPSAPASYQVYSLNLPASWSAPLYAINPASIDVVNQPSGAPFPALISTPPPPGTFSLNYRAEPIAARVWDPAKKLPAAGQPGDLSFAYASIPRADPLLNIQPKPGSPINPSDPNPGRFTFPANLNPTVDLPLAPPLLDNTKVQPTDPFTPMLRAYAGDKVQIRTLVGAHHDSHFFSVDGVKWLFEPGSSNSGYRNNQPMGISEHYEMEFDLPSATAATPRPFADHLYNASARTDAVTAGIWGLMRAYKTAIPNLVPLPNNAPPATPAVLAIAPPPGAKVREFNVVATTAAQALATRTGGQLVYNSRGQVATKSPVTFAPNTSIANPNALIFFRAEDLTNGQLNPKVPIEPLILRAAAGDWIKLTLTNAFDVAKDPAAFRNGTPADAPYGNAQFFSIPQQVGTDNFVNDLNATPAVISPALIAAFQAAGYALAPNAVVTPAQQPGNPIGWAIAPATPTGTSPDPLTDPANMTYALNLNGSAAILVSPTIIENASRSVGLNPQVLGYDITTANGVNVGFNPTVTAAPGQTVTTYWYAGTLTEKNGQLVGTPVEFGAINLNSSDPLMQHPQGLVGGLVIEPEGSTWVEDADMRAAATVTKAGGQGTFRDFVMIAQDDLAMGTTTNSVNYGTEPMSYRYPASGNPVGNSTVDVQGATSNALVGGADPQTPIYTAVAGSEVRFRMLHPAGGAGNDGETLTIDGHVFQEEPFVNDSRTIGYNELSQWFGTRGGHGARDRFDVVLSSAGGDFKVPGDYLYRSLVTIFGSDFTAGKWGIFRVTPLSPPPGPKLQTEALVTAPTAPAKLQAGPATSHPAETPTSKRFRNRAKTVGEQIKASVPDTTKS